MKSKSQRIKDALIKDVLNSSPDDVIQTFEVLQGKKTGIFELGIRYLKDYFGVNKNGFQFFNTARSQPFVEVYETREDVLERINSQISYYLNQPGIRIL